MDVGGEEIEWRTCRKFGDYEINNLLQIRFRKTGRIIKPFRMYDTDRGLRATLMRGNYSYHAHVNELYIDAFPEMKAALV